MVFSTLFLGYLFFMLLFGFIPFVGQIIAFMLLPLFTLGFMEACKQIDQGIVAHPNLLFYGFRSPQMGRLLQLGVLYLIAAITALGLSTLIDDGVFWQVISGQLELTAANVEHSNMSTAMLVSMLLYLPATMAFWFAGPLIAWQNMSLLKAIFYSFIATYRSARAFLIYGLAWFAIGGLLPTVFSVVVAAVTGNPSLIIFIMMPFSMLVTIIFYCSFYPTYKSLFGQTGQTDSMESPAKSTMS